MHSKAGFASLLVASTASAQSTVPLLQKKIPAGQSANPIKANTNAVLPEVDDQSFWFTNFTVGADSHSLLVDTGSSDVYLNPNLYSPSSGSQNLNRDFIITFATTNSNGSGSETVTGDLYQDVVSAEGLTVSNQILGAASAPTDPVPFPHDGLIGFAGVEASASDSTPWFSNLCSQKKVSSCRFGLAFGTDGTGTQTLGAVDPAYANSLSTVPLSGGEWAISGSIIANATTVTRNADIGTDSGTSVVYGPIDTVRSIFQTLNIPISEHQGTDPNSDPSYVYGYTPCDTPPVSQFGIGLGGTTFNIEPAAWNAKDNGLNNCTAVLQGTDGFGEMWLVGQAFLQGKYVDHNVDAQTMGFANLVRTPPNKRDSRHSLGREWNA